MVYYYNYYFTVTPNINRYPLTIANLFQLFRCRTRLTVNHSPLNDLFKSIGAKTLSSGNTLR